MSQNVQGDIYSEAKLQWVVWSIITNMKLRRHQTSNYFHFCEVEGTPLLTAHQTLSTKHKNACVGSVECQRHRVRLDIVWPRVTCPCHVMDTCHVSRVRPCPGHVCRDQVRCYPDSPPPSLPSDSKYLLNCGSSSSARLLLRAVKELSRSAPLAREAPNTTSKIGTPIQIS